MVAVCILTARYHWILHTVPLNLIWSELQKACQWWLSINTACYERGTEKRLRTCLCFCVFRPPPIPPSSTSISRSSSSARPSPRSETQVFYQTIHGFSSNQIIISAAIHFHSFVSSVLVLSFNLFSFIRFFFYILHHKTAVTWLNCLFKCTDFNNNHFLYVVWFNRFNGGREVSGYYFLKNDILLSG